MGKNSALSQNGTNAIFQPVNLNGTSRHFASQCNKAQITAQNSKYAKEGVKAAIVIQDNQKTIFDSSVNGKDGKITIPKHILKSLKHEGTSFCFMKVVNSARAEVTAEDIHNFLDPTELKHYGLDYIYTEHGGKFHKAAIKEVVNHS